MKPVLRSLLVGTLPFGSTLRMRRRRRTPR
jgi:hypothetical protein